MLFVFSVCVSLLVCQWTRGWYFLWKRRPSAWAPLQGLGSHTLPQGCVLVHGVENDEHLVHTFALGERTTSASLGKQACFT